MAALAVMMLAPVGMKAQVKRSKEFNDRYDLKEVVILSRHNIRSPLSGPGSALGEMTPHKWVTWTSAPSELTQRGGALETIMGQFFRKWLADEGMFAENYVPTADEVNVYANSMQRCIATAQYFTSGFMPTAGLRVNHRFSPSKMDPVFNPQITKDGAEFQKEARRQIASRGGKDGMRGINQAIAPNYALMAEVLDLSESPAAKSGKMTGFTDYDTKVMLEKGKEPYLAPCALKDANSASDAFILQYYEEPDTVAAAFGHKNVTREDFKRLAQIKDVYQTCLFSAPIVAVNVANPLLHYMYDELNADARKFTLLVGHDSNIGSVCSALGVEPFEAPQAIEAQTPIGGKLVFEKWVDPATKEEYVAVNLVYQSVDQLRDMSLLSLDNPPMVLPLTLTGLTPNADGLYKLADVNARFGEAFATYDAIPD